MMVKRDHHYFPFPIVFIWIFVSIILLSNSSCAQSTRRIKVILGFLNNIPDVYRGNTIIKSPDLEKDVLYGINRIVNKMDSKLTLSVLDLSKEESMEFFLSLPVPDDPDQLNADFFLWGAFDEREGSLDMELVSVKTARSIGSSIKLTQPFESGIAGEIIDTIRIMLSDDAKLNDITTVKAGGIIDAYDSVVQFKLRTVEGVDLRINVDYDGLHEYVQGINFKQNNAGLSFSPRLTLTCDDGHLIYINFGPEGKANPNNDISTNFDPNGNNDTMKEFTVKSQEEYEIIFQFKWTGGSISDVQIRPKTNPYTPQTYKFEVSMDVGNDYRRREFLKKN